MKRIITTISTLILVCVLSCLAQAQQELSAGASAAQAAAIESLQALEPRNMDEFMENALLYCKLWRNDLAQKNFAKVLEFNPKEEDLIRLHEMAVRRLPNYMEELAESPDLQPAGSVLADKIRDALNNRYHGEESIANTVKEFLAAEWNSDKSRELFAVLNRTADLSAAALLEAMHKEDASKDVKKKAATALASLDASARGPLIAALDAEEPNFVGQCLKILGERKDSEVSYFLYGYTSEQCPDLVKKTALAALKKRGATMYETNSAATMLIQAAKRALDGETYPENCIDGQADVWSWNDEKGKPVHTLYPVRLWQLLHAFRMARGANLLAPNNRTVEKMFWTTEAEFLAAYPDIAREMMVKVSLDSLFVDNTTRNIARINSLLDFALQFKYVSTAVKACQALGHLKSPEALTTTHENVFPPLVCALNSSYPQVRWAACEAIMEINPDSPYLGSSELSKTLTWFLMIQNRKKVLVAAPKSADALAVGRFLPDGYELIIATTGKDALGIIQSNPEICAVFYSMNLYSVPASIFLEKIRNIPVACDIPVAIMADSNRFTEAKRVVNGRPLCLWAPTPSSVADMDRVMEKFEELKPFSDFTKDAISIDDTYKALVYSVHLVRNCYGDHASKNDDKSKSDSFDKIPARHDLALSVEKDVYRKRYNFKSLSEVAQYHLVNNLKVEKSKADELFKLLPNIREERTKTQYPMVEQALNLLKNIPTQDAQILIIDYASNEINPLENRKQAVEAFKYSVEQFGLLLTTPLLTKQYDILNSERDKRSKEILNALLEVFHASRNRDEILHKLETDNAVDNYYGEQPHFETL